MRALTIIPIFFLLGSTLLLILTVINGAGTSSILGRFYWSQTDTSGLTGVPFSTTRWTFYRLCENVNNRNANCEKSKAGFPYSPEDNFGRDSGIPENFISDRDTYFYLSRCGWAFTLVALFFTVVALFFTPLNICFSFGGILGVVCTAIALLFDITAASVITAAHVKGRHQWNRAGFHTTIGAAAFGILWASVATLIISFVSLIVALVFARRSRRRRFNGNNGANGVPESTNGYPKETSSFQRGEYEPRDHAGEPGSDASKFRFFRVKRAKPEDV
ncbi:Protein SUR7 [Candida tropicalis]|nr:SUR7/PalI family protein [Asgard group archaeon]